MIDLGGANGIIFTSVNGVQSALTSTDLPAYCVGQTTAEAAISAGFQVMTIAQNAEDLIAALLEHRPKGPLLHLSGTHTRGQIAERLSAAGILTRRVETYDQVLRPLSPEAIIHLKGERAVILPLYSPRTARQFMGELTGPAPIICLAISQAVAAEVTESAFHRLIVVPSPTGAAMESAIAGLLGAGDLLERGTQHH